MQAIPSFSVIIVSWNVAESLKQCLNSIFATGYDNLEVIVIDNASNDTSAKVAKGFSSVLFIQNTKNIGFPKAVNIGLRQSRGDYLVILNPDTRVSQNFFTQSLNFFTQHPDAWIMGPKLINTDGTIQGSVFPEPSILNSFREFWLGQSGLTAKYVPTSGHPQSVNCISGSCMIMPRSTLDKIGLMTERVFMYFEDLDYCRRIRRLGGKIYFNPKIVIVHEHGNSTKQSARANPVLLPFWKGYLWDSSLWYNGPLKHYVMIAVSWTGQKLFPRSP